MLLREAKELLKRNGYRLVEDTDDLDGMSLRAKIAMAKKFNNNWTNAKFYDAIVDAITARGLNAKHRKDSIIVSGVGEFLIDMADLKDRGTEDIARVLVYVNNDEYDFEVFNLDMQDVESCVEEIVDFICSNEG